MIARIYVQSVINALIDYKDLINISELEKLSIMPNNSIRKVLSGSRQLTALEAAKIASVLNSVLKKTINNNQRTALVSLIYNIGNQAFANSTLLKLINSQASKFDQAKQFDKWIYSNGKINTVLRDRREKEKKIYLS